MRIIAGEFRGRPLRAPKGRTTRPTVDRVRESLMSTIMSARGTWEGAYVLDAFAGSGALGMEALSRGAEYACFCERDREALGCLAVNTVMAEPQRTRIARVDIEKRLPPIPDSPFDLVFFDPPYAYGIEVVAGVLKRLDEADMLADDVLISYEHDASVDCSDAPEFVALQLHHLTRKKYGDTALDLFRKELA
ncbi:16S rRNA (guanine(966)-N(2))-methyltransferase RsmD [Denitrobacterium detoxificans]|uniref:16S rRNA (guanine(966)-N(2))-methyltransferase RsmD n=1 Tax=Denitrobacterium detoxificans TaxID=79604 RepID=UPI0026ECDBF8|nr:16S rRNA (guanine(966)-N(2))-methyltransferase RsmD [Denitrobacterium detoxificans]MBE6465372.1 16S rRNA (guanine(966)-N(2))-methyltransferase RsmD [Denitrobacterium detoxificans]